MPHPPPSKVSPSPSIHFPTPLRNTQPRNTNPLSLLESLILLDTLNPPTAQTPSLLPAFFSAIIGPAASLVAVYHTDVPALSAATSEYAPDPLALLTHLATTVFRVASFHHAVEARRARERSLAEPEWGLGVGREGVLVGLGSKLLRNGGGGGGGGGEGGQEDVVVGMEMRRRSGRAVVEKFVLCGGGGGRGGKVVVVVMGDHPEFRAHVSGEEEGGEMESTFNLGLTEKQRRDREGVVLPYFDAQVDVGGGEGGRILYDMGREDDFDEEDDEI
jgi:elongator complex protein 5